MSKVLITGGVGFIGVNAAKHYTGQGNQVFVLDNLSRTGTEQNLRWLQRNNNVSFQHLDVRNYQGMKKAITSFKPDLILHLAAQVAVTTSVAAPREDMEINVLGTFNLLEVLRESGLRPAVIYSSTNKVYGRMEDVEAVEERTRYKLPSMPHGVSEVRPLDFHSPYGCSKGAADQYMRDYQRIYGIPTVVLRQSCIYGPHQFGVEDQGWVAWFTIAAMLNRPITIYGNGKQVRDVLFIDDLIRAFDLAWQNIQRVQGQIYNIGGGPENSISLLEFLALLENLLGHKIEPAFADWRPGDQPVYISDIRKAKNDLGWTPRVSIASGLESLFSWIQENRATVKETINMNKG